MKFTRRTDRKAKATVEMTPIIDVVFQLLIFFMLSSTFVVQTSIPIEVPEAEGAEHLEQRDVSITLGPPPGGPDNEGRVYVEEIEIQDWAELTQTLSDLRARTPEAMVLLRADATVPTGRLVKVMGITSSAGITNYGIAATSPDAGV